MFVTLIAHHSDCLLSFYFRRSYYLIMIQTKESFEWNFFLGNTIMTKINKFSNPNDNRPIDTLRIYFCKSYEMLIYVFFYLIMLFKIDFHKRRN